MYFNGVLESTELKKQAPKDENGIEGLVAEPDQE